MTINNYLDPAQWPRTNDNNCAIDTQVYSDAQCHYTRTRNATTGSRDLPLIPWSSSIPRMRSAGRR